jgi:hypothetical protein
MTDIWIVLIEDRHSDVDALPSEGGLNEAMRRDGWVLYLPYGTEGDCVRVVNRPLDG